MMRVFLSSVVLSWALAASPLQITTTIGSVGTITSSTYAPTAAESGVAKLIFANGALCSGVAITPTVVLTAAHCIGGLATSATATFTDSGVNTAIFNVASFLVHPSWTNNPLDDVDLALVFLTSPLAAWVSMYQLYNDTDEIGQNYLVAGWGAMASGGAAQGSAGAAGTLRVGNNVWDSTFQFYRPLRSDLLISTFDGPGVNSVFREATVAPGDSGGPSFLNGRVAGITSFIAAPTTPTGAYGDLNGMTRVSSHLTWITTNSVPEPGTFGLVAFAAYCVWARRRASATS
ncbi:MAG: trypsin-like serine protease [Bryobacteraceae bacterium]|nr:trypsin-like serine protease [Bryobacteraceae bacterium]